MNTLTKAGRKTLCIVAAIAVVSFLAHNAAAKGGKPSAPPATLEFRDAASDAVQSDGQGSYEVTVTADQYEFAVSLTAQQEIWLDFSDCDPVEGLSCEGPFGPDTPSSTIPSANISFPNVDWEPGVAKRVGVEIEFQATGKKWKTRHRADVTPYDDNGDGVIDRFVIEDDATTSTRLFKGYGQRRGSGGFTYMEDGSFFMPWAAELKLP